MQSSIFKVYDIRGIVGSELVLENVYNLAQALAFYYKEHNPNLTTVAIGRDGRSHSLSIFDELSRGFMDSGINVINLGVCTTPIMYFAQEKLPVQGGLMITASHNPPEYNGLKLMLNKNSVFGDEIQRIEQYYQTKRVLTSSLKGSLISHDLGVDYVYYLVEQFPELVGSSDVQAVIDCANGTAGSVLPLLKEKFEWKNVHLIYENVSANPDHQADPTNIKNLAQLKKELKKYPNHVGIGFDGDADRMSAITEKGVHLVGDDLGSIFATEIKKSNKECSIVTDVTFSHVLIDWLKQIDITNITSRVGHAYIKQAMKKSNALLGIELSCHFCFADKYFGFDDGIYAMLRLFSVLISSQQTLQIHYEKLPKRFGSALRIPYEPKQKDVIIEHVKKYFSDNPDSNITTLDGICALMPYGWGLIRPSNTEPVLSLRFESMNPVTLAHIKKDFYTALRKHLDSNDLKTAFKL
ncbi:phosphomannomutase/phosphoglucomutase [bacterium]|jgi:phosphomannomutase/phosphoglucomutase|nr:phosphomannomutase/phosphoglucomutase [bacterium]MBT5015231.1 phosphomannomutase/phosphoglucomutase [bacterium]